MPAFVHLKHVAETALLNTVRRHRLADHASLLTLGAISELLEQFFAMAQLALDHLPGPAVLRISLIHQDLIDEGAFDTDAILIGHVNFECARPADRRIDEHRVRFLVDAGLIEHSLGKPAQPLRLLLLGPPRTVGAEHRPRTFLRDLSGQRVDAGLDDIERHACTGASTAAPILPRPEALHVEIAVQPVVQKVQVMSNLLVYIESAGGLTQRIAADLRVLGFPPKPGLGRVDRIRPVRFPLLFLRRNGFIEVNV